MSIKPLDPNIKVVKDFRALEEKLNEMIAAINALMEAKE